MTTSEPAGDDATDAGPTRRWTPARLIRSAAGVDEDVLRIVPSQAARYTSLGLIAAISAVVGALSLATSLYWVFGGLDRAMMVVALTWGVFLFSVNRWFISSVSAGPRATNLLMILPRLALSIMLGLVLAEPIVLGVFDTVVGEAVAQEQQQKLSDLEARLRVCNPTSGPVAVTDPGCTPYRLSLPAGSEERSDYATIIDRAIASDLEQLRSRQADADLLERLSALGRLTESNGQIRAASWMIRVLLFVVDVFPVLLPALVGRSAYDEVLQDRVRRQIKADGLRSELDLERRMNHYGLLRYEAQMRSQTETQRIDEERRIEFANHDERRGELLDALENHLLRTAIGVAVPLNRPDEYAERVVTADLAKQPTRALKSEDPVGGQP